MQGFIIKINGNKIIRFGYYTQAAPATIKAFEQQLPFTVKLIHARVSGQEIWTNNGPKPDIAHENASVFTCQGEVVIGPLKPERAKTAGCFGIYY